MKNPMEYCPCDDFFCPYCGTCLFADEETRDIEEDKAELLCSNCGLVTTVHNHSRLSAELRSELWIKHQAAERKRQEAYNFRHPIYGQR